MPYRLAKQIQVPRQWHLPRPGVVLASWAACSQVPERQGALAVSNRLPTSRCLPQGVPAGSRLRRCRLVGNPRESKRGGSRPLWKRACAILR
eukprot:2714496-Heterocapsa_arctica.AAC.1